MNYDERPGLAYAQPMTTEDARDPTVGERAVVAMNELVERVARAIAVAEGGKMAVRRDGETLTVAAFERYANDHWREYTNHAQFAIGAMREPTESMYEALDCGGEKKAWPSGQMWKHCWQTMIDEALK